MDILLVTIPCLRKCNIMLTRSRNYRNRDRHALKFFIGFLMCVMLSIPICHVTTFVSESWTLYTRFYAHMRSTGKMEIRTLCAMSHSSRYLILNFGNVVNLDYSVW